MIREFDSPRFLKCGPLTIGLSTRLTLALRTPGVDSCPHDLVPVSREARGVAATHVYVGSIPTRHSTRMELGWLSTSLPWKGTPVRIRSFALSCDAGRSAEALGFHPRQAGSTPAHRSTSEDRHRRLVPPAAAGKGPSVSGGGDDRSRAALVQMVESDPRNVEILSSILGGSSVETQGHELRKCWTSRLGEVEAKASGASASSA